MARALSIVAAAEIDAVVSSALDSSVGIAAGVALAAALPRLEHACGLATAALFAQEPAAPALPVDGVLTVGPAPEPDPVILQRLALPADRQRWWRHRVAAAHEVLVASA